MTTYNDNEETRFDNNDEETRFGESTSLQPYEEPMDAEKMEVKENPRSKGGSFKSAAAGAVSGILIGGVAATLMGMKPAGAEGKPDAGDKPSHNHNNEELSHPEWVDDQVSVSTAVNDDMTFGEAFAAARAEVGPGGVFEWHGQLYGTYTAEEWNNMTPEERAEFGSHFSWNNIDHSTSDVAQHTTTDGDDIEIVSVDHENIANDGFHEVDVNPVDPAEPEIEILGVVHDGDSGTNVGAMTIDGQDVILIDVDNDLTFDYLATDANGNGVLDEGEVVDIQGDNLTVNDLGGFTDPAGDSFAANDTDYSTDVYDC